MSKTLDQKSTRYLLVWLPLVLLLGSLLFFIMLNMHSSHMQREQLELKQKNIWKVFVAQPSVTLLHINGEYLIEEGKTVPERSLNIMRDTSLYYPEINENVDLKIFTKQYDFKGKTYQLTTFVSSKEFFHLIIKVFATQAFIFLLLLFAIVIINRISSRLLWQPFYTTMKKTGEYDLVSNQTFLLEEQTGIHEFDQLNKELTNLIEKVNTAYSNQKKFVENASHEIQTPLAIIRSKLELLINVPGISEKIAALLADITEANERLSQMNKSLLLLAKIDNNQFPEQERINVSEFIEKILSNYQEHYDNFPSLTRSISPNVFISANPALIDILLSNLIKNAVVHNVSKGYIKVHLTNDEFIIENTGNTIEEEPGLLFERFRKGNKDSKTTGLGLALVKQIAQIYKIGIRYNYENGIHTVQVIFSSM